MGGQLSSSSPASSITSASSPSASSSNSLSPSPGLSSLGSNGQQSARCRSSSPPTQSASQSSLASSSLFSANSIGVGGGPIGRHSSAALIRPLGDTAIHSPPLLPPSGIGPSPNFGGGGQSRFLISPPMFRRNNQGKNGEMKALSRWGSFTKALPSLVRGNSSAGNHHTKNAGKEHKRQQINHHLGGNGNGGIGLIRKVGMVDPNNNTKNDWHQNTSFYEQRRTIGYSEDEREEWIGGQCQTKEGRDYSLKQSLKKSGSRLFNGILKGGYIRAILGEDEDEKDDEDEESSDEDDKMNGHPDDILNNNSGLDLRQFGTQNAIKTSMAKTMATSNNVPSRLRPSSTSFFHGGGHHHPNQQQAPSKSSIGTCALRTSLRQAKRHFLIPGHHPGNGNGPIGGGNGLVSSMLLAMAAGQPPPPISTHNSHSIARPFSCSTNDSGGQMMLDLNGNNARNLTTTNGQKKKIIQASSSELIRALGHFVSQHCRPGLLGQFEPSQLSTWLRGVDRALFLQGWQDAAFINPANLVFLFMLIRDAFVVHGDCQRLNSLRELHSFVLLCLYISYSYMGNEISYPLKPFITENTNRTLFWSQCVRLIKRHSGQMLRLNSSSTFFLEVFTELRAYSPEHLIETKASYY